MLELMIMIMIVMSLVGTRLNYQLNFKPLVSRQYIWQMLDLSRQLNNMLILILNIKNLLVTNEIWELLLLPGI